MERARACLECSLYRRLNVCVCAGIGSLWCFAHSHCYSLMRLYSSGVLLNLCKTFMQIYLESVGVGREGRPMKIKPRVSRESYDTDEIFRI